MLLRNVAIPNAVWTLGDNRHGQCGHTANTPADPHPVALDLAVLRDGVRSVQAGPYCTVVVTNAGDGIGFGTGPFRAASDGKTDGKAEREATNVYEGAPPFRVETFAGFGPIKGSGKGSGSGGEASSAADGKDAGWQEPDDEWLLGMAGGAARMLFGAKENHGANSNNNTMAIVKHDGRASSKAYKSVPQAKAAAAAAAKAAAGRNSPQEGIKPPTGGKAFDTTEEKVAATMQQRAGLLSELTPLTGMLMPVEQICGGDDFCVSLMQNGLVFSWGDGEEGRLGLGQQQSYEKPTMVDALLPTAYAEVAKKSENKDALLKAGSRIIRSRGRAFEVTSLACGARHTLALTSTSEIFTWGSGCCGQLGHGTRHDELLPRPITGLHKNKGLRCSAIACGAYHSMAIIGFSKRRHRNCTAGAQAAMASLVWATIACVQHQMRCTSIGSCQGVRWISMVRTIGRPVGFST